MSTADESSPEILIPSLPNDIALQCLARVPRRYHPVLSAVSKPIRSLLSSHGFFSARSALNCTEILPYLRIQIAWQNIHPDGWFTVYGNGRASDGKSNIVIAPVPGVSVDRKYSSNYATLGSEIYVLGDSINEFLSTELWIFDCRFHTWEQGPKMPTTTRIGAELIALDGKIYAMGWDVVKEFWTYVLDTVGGRWESHPSPKLRVNDIPLLGCGISEGGKVCVWLEEEEEARFDPETKTWEVFPSRIRSGLPSGTPISEVNGVLYCLHSLENTPEVAEVHEDTLSSYVFKCFDERIGEWKKLKLVNNRGLPSRLSRFSMLNVGGRLVITGRGYLQGENIVTRNLAEKVGIWCAEIEVNKDENGDFSGEVLWSEMVYSTEAWFIDKGLRVPCILVCTCVAVSL